MQSLIRSKTKVSLQNKPISSLTLNNVRVKVCSVGLCRTDLMVANGSIKKDFDIVLGHECSGIVLESQSSLFKKGDWVIINPYFKEKGFMGLDFDGCLQEQIIIPDSQLILNISHLSHKIASYLEPVSTSMSVLSVCTDKKAIGCVYGNNRIAELTYIVLTQEGFNVEWAHQLNEYNKYDYIIETELDEDILSKMISSLKEEGTLIIKSRNKQKLNFQFSSLIEKELSIQATHYYDFNKSLQWLMTHQQKVTHLLGESYPIVEWEDAFRVANQSETKKIFIHF